MKIIKILNNNTVIVEIKNKEFVITGKGIGFGKNINDKINENQIEKKYYSYNIPIKYYELTKDIIDFTEENMNIKFNSNIYVSLTDHIYNAINRTKNNIILKNNLLNEIKIIYKKEFKYALDAISYIYKVTNILLPEDEAGFITVHFINAQNHLNTDYQITIHINNIINIITNNYNFDPYSNYDIYQRLITHLKYLIIHKIEKYKTNENIDDIYEILKFKYSNIKIIIDNINEYFINNLNTNLNKSEYVYLILYIKQLLEVNQ